MPVWTVYVKHQNDSSWGVGRKWKNFEINKKVRNDSPTEFSATIEYNSSINFYDLIKFERDDTVEWAGFVEDIEIAWDESGRYLNITGRDLTLLLWRKYVENFNNAIANTEGFFGNVNAAELLKFLLRTPRSDLPEVPDDSDSNAPSIYPYNKEGWGIDISNFLGLEAKNTGFGDINTTILRKREMLWSNSGNDYESNDPSPPDYWGVVNNYESANSWNWDLVGSPPYVNISDGTSPSNYIKSQVGKNATIVFDLNGLDPATNPTVINNCFLVIKEAPDGSWDWWDGSNCYVYIWLNSQNAWCQIGNFGGRSSSHGLYDMSALSWKTLEFDISGLLRTVDDVNNAQVKFVETGSLSTYIEYCYLSVGYAGSGKIDAGEWVNIMFNPIDCMGVYIESRADANQFPRNYHITTNGGLELFDGYTAYNASDSYVTLNSALDQINFNSYQSIDASKVAYFYKDYGAGNPIGDGFDESFSFMITSSQPCTTSPDYATPAFIPFCLSDATAGVNDFYTLWNGSGNVTAFCVVNFEGNLLIQTRIKNGIPTVSTSAPYLNLNQQYWLHITIVGSTITYSLYSSSNMEASSLIYTQSYTCGTYEYRYQAISYKSVSWAELFDADMTGIGVGGEFIVNGGFETGSLSPWTDDPTRPNSINSDPAYVRTGSYSAKVPNYGYIAQSIGRGAVKDSLTTAGFWVYGGGSTDGMMYLVYWDHDPADYDVINWSAPTTGWNYINVIPNLRTDGSQLEVLEVFCNQDTYVDDFSIYIPIKWDSATGTATRTTNTSKQRSGQTACQQIRCTSDGQDFYWVKDFTDQPETVKVDAWLRMPPPKSEAGDGDVLVDTQADNIMGWVVNGSSGHWGGYGSAPYIQGHDYMDDNHIFMSGSQSMPFESTDYCTFQSVANALGKAVYSLIPSGSHLYVSARIQNNQGGTGAITSLSFQANLWIPHSSSWMTMGVGGFSNTTWTDIDMGDISSYLTCEKDWADAKISFWVNSATITGDGHYCEFQIGQCKLHFSGTISHSQLSLIKLINKSSGNVQAEIAVQSSRWATSSQNYQRFCMWANGTYRINGEWGYGWFDFPVPNGLLDSPDPWVHISVFSHVGDGDGYLKLFNITGWDGVSVDVNGFPTTGAYLLCEVAGLVNIDSGYVDRLQYGAWYYYDYGDNSEDYSTYLDEIKIYAETQTHTTGIIRAGEGPEQTLITVTDNLYPDLLHSWCPQTMSNIKIYVDDDETDHGWEITQIYVYKTDPVKYRVVLDDCTDLTDEYKLTFRDSGYTPTIDNDIGLEVYHNSYDGFIGPNYIGTLLSANDDNYEWRVDLTGGHHVPVAGDVIVLATHDGGAGTGTGTLDTSAVSVYSGGPYLYLGDENIDLQDYQGDPVMIGPTNIPKNRLLDTLWDICVYVNDDYQPFEWWITYPSVGDPTRCIGDFHIGSHRGSDKSASVSFKTGINMEGVKLQKSSRDTYQRCQLIGSGEGKNQDDCSSFWQNDEDAMDEIQGFFEDIITQKQVSGGRVANRYAKVRLKLDASPKRKNGIECTIGRDTYSSGTYDVGDDVLITDPFTGLGPADDEGGVYRIWNSKISGDDNGEKVVLTVQAPYLDISNVWKDVYGKLKQMGIMGTIATDWAGQGTQADTIGADKLSNVFSLTAKNEETTPKGSSDPKWVKTQTGSGADTKLGDSNASVWGGNSASDTGVVWTEARYNGSYDTSGNPITTDVCDIPMTQEPKFTTTFKVYEGVSPDAITYWNVGDYSDFGMLDHDKGTGFVFRVFCRTLGHFAVYGIYFTSLADYLKSTDDLIAAGNAKEICEVHSNHKYKAVIEVEYNSGTYGNPIPEVVLTITDEEIDNSPSKNVVFTKYNAPIMASTSFGNMTVRPLYLLASGGGGSNFRCQMNFYELKAQRDVI